MWWWFLGCGVLDDGPMADRELTMLQHWEGTETALKALRDQDDPAFQGAMRDLIRAGDVPQIAYAADLQTVKDRARTLKGEDDWDRRRAGMVSLLGTCAGCHRVNSIRVPTTSTPDPLLRALLWEDEAGWKAGCGTAPGCGEAVDWRARRQWIVTR